MEKNNERPPLTDAEIEAIKDKVLASVYEDIGRSLVKKILWIVGSLLFMVFGWAAAKGYITLKLGSVVAGWRLRKEKKIHDSKREAAKVH